MSDVRKVYSSQLGRLCPGCGKAVDSCVCRTSKQRPKGDGVVRVRREVKGRGGKTVTVVMGLPLNDKELKEMASLFKQRFAVGGAIKEGNIEIQGDHADVVVSLLKERGFQAKRSGG